MILFGIWSPGNLRPFTIYIRKYYDVLFYEYTIYLEARQRFVLCYLTAKAPSIYFLIITCLPCKK